jgi:TPR repeat protein
VAKTSSGQVDISKLTECAKAGDVKAIRYLGYAYTEGVGVSQNYQQAEYFAAQGCELGDDFCCLQRGTLLFALKRANEAAIVFGHLIDREYLPAFYRLGLHYFDGKVTTADRVEGERLLRIAATRGHFYAVRKVAAIDWRRSTLPQKLPVALTILRNSYRLYKLQTANRADDRFVS